MTELIPITEEDIPKLVAAAAEDDHRIVAPTHKIVKDGEIVGAVGFDSIPLMTWWLHTEKGKARDTLKLLPELDAVSEGYTASTTPEAWRIVDGRLYLNYSRRIQRRWERDIPGNIAAGDANGPNLL